MKWGNLRKWIICEEVLVFTMKCWCCTTLFWSEEWASSVNVRTSEELRNDIMKASWILSFDVAQDWRLAVLKGAKLVPTSHRHHYRHCWRGRRGQLCAWGRAVSCCCVSFTCGCCVVSQGEYHRLFQCSLQPEDSYIVILTLHLAPCFQAYSSVGHYRIGWELGSWHLV